MRKSKANPISMRITLSIDLNGSHEQWLSQSLLISAGSASPNAPQELANLVDQGASINYRCAPDGATPLHVAAAMGLPKSVEVLIARGAQIDARTSVGATPLHGACARGRRRIIEALIDAGAHIDRADRFGRTPFHYAIAAGAPGMSAARLLIERYKEDPFQKTPDGTNMVELAATSANPERDLMIQCLLDIQRQRLAAQPRPGRQAVTRFSIGP